MRGSIRNCSIDNDDDDDDNYDDDDDDGEVINTVFRNNAMMEETRHESYYAGSEGFIFEQGGRTLVRAFQLF